MTQHDTDDDRFNHLDRIQRRIMGWDSRITRSDWDEATPQEKDDYYRWMCNQIGELADLV
jgi:hypothetical protein